MDEAIAERLNSRKPYKFYTSYYLQKVLKESSRNLFLRSSSVPELKNSGNLDPKFKAFLIIHVIAYFLSYYDYVDYVKSPKKKDFVPFLNERDSMGRIIDSKNEYY